MTPSPLENREHVDRFLRLVAIVVVVYGAARATALLASLWRDLASFGPWRFSSGDLPVSFYSAGTLIRGGGDLLLGIGGAAMSWRRRWSPIVLIIGICVGIRGVAISSLASLAMYFRYLATTRTPSGPGIMSLSTQLVFSFMQISGFPILLRLILL